MKKSMLIAAAAVLLIGAAAPAVAEDNDRLPGASGNTPGHEMQEHGSVPGHPGASGYAPGHQNRDRGVLQDRDDRTPGGR